ncbi:MAG: AAA family ATPase [Eubacteriales bacterium]
MDYKPLPIGIDNFQEMIERECYYVDKTLLLKKLLDNTVKVSLFTRPRRFGKSLNLSMLKYFFEKSETDHSYLFAGLKIADAGEKYTKHMGKYPVIMLNFKEGKQPTFDSSYDKIQVNISKEFKRHEKILDLDVLDDIEMSKYRMIQKGNADWNLLTESVVFLCECLEKAYGEKVIVLLDEYDVPLENAYFKGFYEEMIGFIRGILSAALKTNNSLFMGIITGCLRISKESIFTGLNNLEIISIENEEYGEYFGFTEDEVEEMLVYYKKTYHLEQIQKWYNGYLFGATKVYNPWSLMNHMKQIMINDKKNPLPYWSNTSANSIVRDLIEQSDSITKTELEELMAGGSIEKPIHEDITYEDIYVNTDNLWNFLYFTGYLKKISERFEGRKTYALMKIPNEEVGYIYETHIQGWISDRIQQADFTKLYEATLAGNPEIIEEEINCVLWETVSYFDTANSQAGETFYHGLLLGLYAGLSDYQMLSNRESGNGRADLIIKGPSFKGKAYIFEFKIAKKTSELMAVTREALAQIEKQQYRDGLLTEGYTDITVYGIGFFHKSCRVVKG